jgi:hypothetical protein
MHITIKIDNVYDDETVSNTIITEVPDAPSDIDEREDWAFDHLFPLTGTGRVHGDAGYFVEVLTCTDPTLVGQKFEWGI